MAGSHRSRNVSAPRRASDVWVQPRLRNCLCHRSPARDRLLVLADEALRVIPPRTSCERVKQVHWCTEARGLRGDGVRRAEMMNSSAFAVCLLLFGPTVFAQPVSEALGELLEGKAAFGDWRADAP